MVGGMDDGGPVNAHYQIEGRRLTATVYKITERSAAGPGLVVDHQQDFALQAAGNLDPEALLSPQYSLYSLDPANQRAVFVDVPSEAGLSEAPFYSTAQHRLADNLMQVSYEDFLRLSDSVRDPERLVLIYNTARCGSTLLHQIFNKSGEVVSLSEPGVLTQLQLIRPKDGSLDEELLPRLKASVKLMSRPKEEAPSARAIKLRLGGALAPLLARAFPDATRLFLYREPIGWAASMHRAFASWFDAEIGRALGSDNLKEQLIPFDRTFPGVLGLLFKSKIFAPNEGEFLAASWLRMLEDYEALDDGGQRFLAMRYEELTRHPREAVAAIFEHCGLVLDDVGQALEAFGADSQKGTSLAWDSRDDSRRLRDVDRASMLSLIDRQPVINSPDYLVANTWLPNGSAVS